MVSRMCAPSQKKSATGKDERKAPNPFTSKKDSPDALFEIMDKEGRGKGSYQFWYTKTYEEKMGYCRWLIEKKKVGSRTDFARKAPGFIANYFMNRALWDELGILDKRDGNKANCRQKNDSPDAPFEMMDRKGRGRGNYEFWEGKARTERIDYCKWLIKKEGIKSRTEFSKKAPCFISNYIRNNLLWDEIGLLDRRIGNPRLNGPKKRPAEAPKRHVPEAPKPERGAKRIHRRNPLLAEKLGIREGEASAIDPVWQPVTSCIGPNLF